MKFLKGIRFYFSIIAIVMLVGCVRSFYHKPLNYAADKNGWLIIYCSNPPGQSEVVGHIVQVDGHDTFEVAAQGQVPIFLNASKHKLRFLSVGSLSGSHPYPGYTIFHDNFYIYGYPTEIDLTVIAGKRKEIKYVAPFWNNEAGMVKILR